MGIGAVAAATLGLLSAQAAPTNFVAIDGNIRQVPANGGTYDWANSGTTFDTTTCANGGIHAVGTNGLFDCGKPGTSTGPLDLNPVPIPPVLTPAAAADPEINAAAFLVDPIYNSNRKNTHMECPSTSPDTFTSSGDPSVLVGGGSKNNLPFSGFRYNPTSFQPKDDLGNVYAISHRTDSVHEVFFGAERTINNGSSHIDFEFLQSEIGLVPDSPTSCSGGVSGHRTEGDFLAAIEFTNGGALGSAKVFKWECSGLLTTPSNPPVGTVCDPGTAAFPNAQYVEVPNPGAFAKLQVNAGAAAIPCGGWVCRDQIPSSPPACRVCSTLTVAQCVSQNEFMEGAIDISSLGFTGCVSTFLPHTRSSGSSINSTLQDIAGPVSFDTCDMTTQPGAAVTEAGSTLTDTATVSGFFGPPSTTSFSLYGPFASSNAITPTSCIDSGVGQNLVFNSGAVTTADTTSPAHYTTTTSSPVTATGVYQWVANYDNGTILGSCGDTTEQAKVVDGNITIAASAVNEVTNAHTFTVTVNGDSGSGAGLQPVAGVNPTVTLSPVPGSVVDNCALTGTNAAGQCTVVINSTVAGTFVANASATLQRWAG